ncbi:MAG: hypothetical protein EXX96DRAFT_574773 [Benjaminiella poitrasii]|nr:MAG: hypothetical protein EXX96DRAFT_574773 [Benjaminiella poitrasii]
MDDLRPPIRDHTESEGSPSRWKGFAEQGIVISNCTRSYDLNLESTSNIAPTIISFSLNEEPGPAQQNTGHDSYHRRSFSNATSLSITSTNKSIPTSPTVASPPQSLLSTTPPQKFNALSQLKTAFQGTTADSIYNKEASLSTTRGMKRSSTFSTSLADGSRKNGQKSRNASVSFDKSSYSHFDFNEVQKLWNSSEQHDSTQNAQKKVLKVLEPISLVQEGKSTFQEQASKAQETVTVSQDWTSPVQEAATVSQDWTSLAQKESSTLQLWPPMNQGETLTPQPMSTNVQKKPELPSPAVEHSQERSCDVPTTSVPELEKSSSASNNGGEQEKNIGAPSWNMTTMNNEVLLPVKIEESKPFENNQTVPNEHEMKPKETYTAPKIILCGNGMKDSDDLIILDDDKDYYIVNEDRAQPEWALPDMDLLAQYNISASSPSGIKYSREQLLDIKESLVGRSGSFEVIGRLSGKLISVYNGNNHNNNNNSSYVVGFKKRCRENYQYNEKQGKESHSQNDKDDQKKESTRKIIWYPIRQPLAPDNIHEKGFIIRELILCECCQKRLLI